MLDNFRSYHTKKEEKKPTGNSLIVTKNYSPDQKFLVVNTQDTPIELGECFTITDLVPLADSPIIEVGSGLARVNLMNVETGKIISLSGSTRKIQNMFDLVYEEDTHVSEPSEKIIEIVKHNLGEQGPPGEQGPRGDIGPQGVVGERGLRGLQGEQGIQGEQGERGEQGLPGEKGEQGERGEQGEQGEQGLPGENGKDGLDGRDGKDGIDGTNGIDGKDGVDGKDGKDGIDGKDGKDGVDGKDGERGQQGNVGPIGEKGEKGDPGERATISELWEEIKVGKGLKFNTKKKELWLDPNTFPPVPVGQLGGAVIGGGGSNTGVRSNGTKIRDTARFIDFATDFTVEKSGSESVSVKITPQTQASRQALNVADFELLSKAEQTAIDASDPSIVLTSDGNNEIFQDLDLKDNEIKNVKIDGGTFS